MCCAYFEPTTHLTRILENQELFFEIRALRSNIVSRCPIGLPVPII